MVHRTIIRRYPVFLQDGPTRISSALDQRESIGERCRQPDRCLETIRLDLLRIRESISPMNRRDSNFNGGITRKEVRFQQMSGLMLIWQLSPGTETTKS